jgi:hypothetical protein
MLPAGCGIGQAARKGNPSGSGSGPDPDSFVHRERIVLD